MIELKPDLKSLGLDNAIRLRWVLRDIEGKRLKWSPPDPNDLRILVDLGLVEIRNEVLSVTGAGIVEIDIGD